MRDGGLIVVLGLLAGSMVGCAKNDAKLVEMDARKADVSEVSCSAPVDHTPRNTPALHNLVQVTPKLVSGALPEGDAAFDELKAMGITTIISVDGAAPDVKAAESRGMRYVHIPLRYEGYTREQQLELARAVRDLPGPIYMHCHHGKHRSPAAAASAAVLLGELTADEGVAVMKAAGTAPTYKGLYQCVATAMVADISAIESAPAEFVPVAKVSGLVEAMVEADHAFDHLKLIKESAWSAPADHPDLVPVAEAGRLADALRIASEDHTGNPRAREFEGALVQASKDVEALEALLANGAGDVKARDEVFARIGADCKACHVKYRD